MKYPFAFFTCLFSIFFIGIFLEKKLLSDDEFFTDKSFSKNDLIELAKKYKQNGELENTVNCYLYLMDNYNMSIDEIKEFEKDDELLNILVLNI